MADESSRETTALAVIKKLLNRGGFDAWYEDLDNNLQAEILAEIASALTEPATVAPVGEVTELVSAKVHESWLATKRATGVTTRKLETGEELMAPYAELSEQAKDLDRGTVRTVLSAMAELGLLRVRSASTGGGEVAWVKCSERMPEELQPVLVVESENATPEPYIAFREDDEWHVYSSSFAIRGATHWMPLPAPPAPELVTAEGGT